MKVKTIKTKYVGEITKYTFATHVDLEQFFIDNIEKFYVEKLKTKVIGLTLLTFKQPRRGKK